MTRSPKLRSPKKWGVVERPCDSLKLPVFGMTLSIRKRLAAMKCYCGFLCEGVDELKAHKLGVYGVIKISKPQEKRSGSRLVTLDHTTRCAASRVSRCQCGRIRARNVSARDVSIVVR